MIVSADHLGHPVHPGDLRDRGASTRSARLDASKRQALPLRARRPRHHGAADGDHRVLHRHALEAGQGHRRGLDDRPRDEHHRGPRLLDAGHRGARDRDRRRHPRRLQAGRPPRHRHRRRRDALDGRRDHRARRLRPGHGQRRRHRRDGGPARGGALRRSPIRSTPSATRPRPSRRATRSAPPASPRWCCSPRTATS